MIAVTLPVFAKESTSNDSSNIRVGLEVRQTQEKATKVHRAPLRISIEVYYNEQNGSMDIYYDGEALGETFLYLNDNIIDYNSEINTSFLISEPGLYRIEIVGETWIAQGYIQI